MTTEAILLSLPKMPVDENLDCELSHYCPIISGLGGNEQGWRRKMYPQRKPNPAAVQKITSVWVGQEEARLLRPGLFTLPQPRWCSRDFGGVIAKPLLRLRQNAWTPPPEATSRCCGDWRVFFIMSIVLPYTNWLSCKPPHPWGDSHSHSRRTYIWEAVEKIINHQRPLKHPQNSFLRFSTRGLMQSKELQQIQTL